VRLRYTAVMDRRTIIGSILIASLTGGIGAVTARGTISASSPYADVLFYGGLASIVVGLLGLAWLVFLKASVPEDETPAIWVGEAGTVRLSKNRYGAGGLFRSKKVRRFAATENEPYDKKAE